MGLLKKLQDFANLSSITYISICAMAYNTAMTTVAILYGGISSEREISIRSAKAVAGALESAGYTIKQIDTAPLNSQQLLAALEGVDVVFPALHGAGGEDGKPQQWLEERKFAYVGSDAASSAVCFDKTRYKKTVAQFGVMTAAGTLVTAQTFWESPIIQRPFVLKPNSGGSSVDTVIVRDAQAIDEDAVRSILETYDTMLLEELIEGIEITVGIVGDTALPVIEIIPPDNGEFDYENKYNGKSQELCPPEHISADIQKRAQTIALKIHRQLRLRDMSRTDMIVRSGDNALVVLETNTIPGLTNESLLPKAARTAGMDMASLVTSLVEAAHARDR